MHNLPLDEALRNSPFYRRGMTRRDVPAHIKPEDIVKLSSNENPFGVSPAVVEAIKEQASILNLYPPMDGDHNLCAALAKLHDERFTAENVVAGKGGLDILDMAVRGFVRAGDNVIVSNPTFRFLGIAAIRIGAEVINVPLKAESFEYDVDAVLAAVNERTRIVYICNPNNPTGNVTSSETMARLVDELPDDILIISDEAYSQFAAPFELPDTTSYVLEGRPVLKLFSFSKAFGLAGLRLGYGIGGPDVVSYMEGYKTPFHLGRVTIAAGIAAVGDTEYMDSVIQRNRAGRDWVTGQAKELGIEVWPSAGNFTLMRVPDIGGAELTQKCLEQGVLISDGERRFGLPEHVRITVGTESENQRLIEVLGHIVSDK